MIDMPEGPSSSKIQSRRNKMSPASLTFNLQAVATARSAVTSNNFVPNVVGGARAVRRSSGTGGGLTCSVPQMEAFLLYPVTGASIAHKLLSRGLRTCLGFKDDSTAAATDYIASINASASQLSHMKPMTVPDVYALVTLMGLYLSEASGHQKAYKELLADVDDGHELTLDTVQNVIIRFSRSRSARAVALTRSGDTPECTHGCPRCCAVPRGDTPGHTSRSSSRASSPRAHRTFRTVHDHEHWDNLGLDDEHHVFAAILSRATA
jgi:hypothetical protein